MQHSPTPPRYRADAIVVLGRGLEVDGHLPLLGKQRVETAAALFAWETAPRIIFAGRCSLMTETEPRITEAHAMADYAVSLGLPRDALLCEEESRDTIGNAYFTMRLLLEPNEWTSIRVVTSDFHIQRASWVFRRVLGVGYDVSFTAAPSELSAETIAARAREESDITAFLMDWMRDVPDGDPIALSRLIWTEHPGYAEQPTVTREDIQERIAEFARAHRAEAKLPAWAPRRIAEM